MIDTGDPHLDRNVTDYFRLQAENEYQQHQQQQQHRQSIADAERCEYIRRHIGELLGVYKRDTGLFDGAPEYKMRFVIEVRSQLEYDEDFFDVANVALRNMDHWNDPARIALALSHSNDRFALNRLIRMNLGSRRIGHGPRLFRFSMSSSHIG